MCGPVEDYTEQREADRKAVEETLGMSPREANGKMAHDLSHEEKRELVDA